MEKLDETLGQYDPTVTPDVAPEQMVGNAKAELTTEITRLKTKLKTNKLGKAPLHLSSTDAYFDHYTATH